MALSDRIMTSGDVINDLHDRIIQDEQLIRQMRDALQWTVEQGGGPACEHESGGDVCFCKENQAIAAANARLEGT